MQSETAAVKSLWVTLVFICLHVPFMSYLAIAILLLPVVPDKRIKPLPQKLGECVQAFTVRTWCLKVRFSEASSDFRREVKCSDGSDEELDQVHSSAAFAVALIEKNSSRQESFRAVCMERSRAKM